MARKEKPADALWAFLIDPHLWKSDYLGTRAKWKRPQRHMWLQLPPPAAPPCFTSPFHPTFLLRSPLVTIYCLSDGLFYVADLDRNGSVRQKHPARNNISHQIKKKRKKKKGKSVCSTMKCRTWLRRRQKGFQWEFGYPKDFNGSLISL